MSRRKYIKNINIFKVVVSKWILGILMFCLFLAASKALGIGAASFAIGASKDIAESPTAEPERPKEVFPFGIGVMSKRIFYFRTR